MRLITSDDLKNSKKRSTLDTITTGQTSKSNGVEQHEHPDLDYRSLTRIGWLSLSPHLVTAYPKTRMKLLSFFIVSIEREAEFREMLDGSTPGS